MKKTKVPGKALPKKWRFILAQYEIDTRLAPIFLSDWLDKKYPLSKFKSK